MTRPEYGRMPDGYNDPTEILASTQGLEKIGIELKTQSAAGAASLTTNMTGNTNNDLVFTANELGVDGNRISVQLVNPDLADQPLSVVVNGAHEIVVNLATGAGPGKAITTIASDIKTAIEADEVANSLVSVANKSNNNGTGVVEALAESFLTGGTAAGGAVLEKGTVLGVVTATGLWVAYDDDGTDDGRRVAKAVLADKVELSVAQADLRLNAVAYIHGSFVKANLTGLDSNGEADLYGRTVGAVFTF
jgi:hypothetical protein